MPVQRIPTAEGELEKAIEDIERKTSILHVVSDGPGAVLVFTAPKATRAKPGAKETRG